MISFIHPSGEHLLDVGEDAVIEIESPFETPCRALLFWGNQISTKKSQIEIHKGTQKYLVSTFVYLPNLQPKNSCHRK